MQQPSPAKQFTKWISKIGYTESVDSKDFQWVFENETTNPLLSYLMNNISTKNVLPVEAIQQYEALCHQPNAKIFTESELRDKERRKSKTSLLFASVEDEEEDPLQSMAKALEDLKREDTQISKRMEQKEREKLFLNDSLVSACKRHEKDKKTQELSIPDLSNQINPSTDSPFPSLEKKLKLACEDYDTSLTKLKDSIISVLDSFNSILLNAENDSEDLNLDEAEIISHKNPFLSLDEEGFKQYEKLHDDYILMLKDLLQKQFSVQKQIEDEDNNTENNNGNSNQKQFSMQNVLQGISNAPKAQKPQKGIGFQNEWETMVNGFNDDEIKDINKELNSIKSMFALFYSIFCCFFIFLFKFLLFLFKYLLILIILFKFLLFLMFLRFLDVELEYVSSQCQLEKVKTIYKNFFKGAPKVDEYSLSKLSSDNLRFSFFSKNF